MKKFFFSPWSYRMLRWGLAMAFFYAGASKMASPASFAILIDAYGILPRPLLMPAAVGLPLLEVIAAIGLLFNRPGSLEVITALMVIFVGVLAYGIALGLDVDCGCFAPGDPEGEAYHGLRPALYRDFWMLGGIVYLYLYRYRHWVAAGREADAETHPSKAGWGWPRL